MADRLHFLHSNESCPPSLYSVVHEDGLFDPLFPRAHVYSCPVRQKGYRIDITLLAVIVIRLVLVALR
jgi:hypothetical protein